MKNPVEVWYLYHSGFAAKINNKLLIFDYYSNRPANDGPSLYNGIFNPGDFKDHDVFVFVSHRHRDHYNPVIFRWMNENPNISLIISSDVKGYKSHPNIYKTEPDNKYEIRDIYAETFASTDEGIAFLVKAEETVLFHAGDLHWWHWDGEPDSFNRQMEIQYKAQVEKLKSTILILHSWWRIQGRRIFHCLVLTGLQGKYHAHIFFPCTFPTITV